MNITLNVWLSAMAVTCMASTALAGGLTVVSFGGVNKAAQTKAYYVPFTRATGVPVTGGEYNGEMGKIKAMVDTHSVSWDVVEMETPELMRGCDEGQFEKLDYSKINKNDFVPGAVQSCGIGLFVNSMVLAYNADKLKHAPTGWKDFGDVKKFPGKRALRKGAKYTLEVALMADGVAPNDVYKVLATPAGQDRAFKELDRLKPYIQWWEAASQPPQYLVSGDVVMSSSYNGRISTARQEGKNLKLVWNGSMYDFDSWAIPKGSPNKDSAMKFIAFASRPENQKVFSEQMAYGPTNKKALGLLPKNVLSEMPSAPQNLQHAIAVNVAFWADYGDALEQRFNAWAAKP